MLLQLRMSRSQQRSDDEDQLSVARLSAACCMGVGEGLNGAAKLRLILALHVLLYDWAIITTL